MINEINSNMVPKMRSTSSVSAMSGFISSTESTRSAEACACCSWVSVSANSRMGWKNQRLYPMNATSSPYVISPPRTWLPPPQRERPVPSAANSATTGMNSAEMMDTRMDFLYICPVRVWNSPRLASSRSSVLVVLAPPIDLAPED